MSTSSELAAMRRSAVGSLDALFEALDAAAARERRFVEELSAARGRIRALERAQERDMLLIAQQTELIETLGSSPARSAA